MLINSYTYIKEDFILGKMVNHVSGLIPRRDKYRKELKNLRILHQRLAILEERKLRYKKLAVEEQIAVTKKEIKEQVDKYFIEMIRSKPRLQKRGLNLIDKE